MPHLHCGELGATLPRWLRNGANLGEPASHVVVSLRETEVSIVMWVPQNVDGLENMETPHWDDIWGAPFEDSPDMLDVSRLNTFGLSNPQQTLFNA